MSDQQEKVIISGNFKKSNIVANVFFVLAALSLIISLSSYPWDAYGYGYYATTPPGLSDYLVDVFCFWPAVTAITFYLFIVLLFIGVYYWLLMRGCEITVTDKRVYGRAAFGKQIDLPINQVSSVGTCYGQGVFAATSSGIIRFWLLDNQMEVYHAMSALLRDKQTAVVQPTVVASSGDADELKKFKMLLDDGVITQEEFDAKKKQILGL